MWYLALVLYAYCGVVASFVAAELDHRRGGPPAPESIGDILLYALTALLFWPFAAACLYEEWTS